MVAVDVLVQGSHISLSCYLILSSAGQTLVLHVDLIKSHTGSSHIEICVDFSEENKRIKRCFELYLIKDFVLFLGMK